MIRCNDLIGLLKQIFIFHIIGLSSYSSLRMLINKISSLLRAFSLTTVIPLNREQLDNPVQITKKLIDVLGIQKVASMYNSNGFNSKGYYKEIDAINSKEELDYYAKNADNVLKKYFNYTEIGKTILSEYLQIIDNDNKFTIMKPVLPSGIAKAYLVFIKTERNN